MPVLKRIADQLRGFKTPDSLHSVRPEVVFPRYRNLVCFACPLSARIRSKPRNILHYFLSPGVRYDCRRTA